MQQVKAYLAPASEAETSLYLAACHEYARSRGFSGRLPSESFVQVHAPGVEIDTVLRTLSGGDALIIPSIRHLGATPSAVYKVISETIARGIQIHALDIGGQVVAHLMGILTGLECAQSIEGEVQQLQADLALMEQRHSQDMEDLQQSLLDQFLNEGLVLKSKANGHADEP